MTTTPEQRTATLSELVAEEIRALMGRRRVSQAQLARGIGKTEMWVSLRLRGRQPIDLNDMMLIAGELGVGIHDLLPSPEVAARARPLNVHSDGPGPYVRPTSPRPVTPRPASRPLVPTRRDTTRPGSPVPPSRRRPSPVRPGDRLVAA